MSDSPSPWKRPGIWWRLAAPLAVLSIGLVALGAGVGLSERAGVHEQGPATWVYYLLGLFVFGGLDLGVPTGGPTWARNLLWISYFGAPAITTTAIAEGILRILRPEAWRSLLLREHTVVGGCGRLAQLFMLYIRDREPRGRFLVVERSAESPYLQAMDKAPRTEVLLGDVTSESVLRSLRLKKARRVFLLTGDDLANLDAASRICALYPHLAGRVVAHVSDIRLLRLMEGQRLLPGVKKLNAYRIAASHWVREILLPHFQKTERLDTVVLAGFGRFGQTVLHVLQEEAEGYFQTVVIIDLEAKVRADVFKEQVGFRDTYKLHVEPGDLRDPALWARIYDSFGDLGTRPVFVLGSGSDSVNLRTALWLSESYDENARIVARCFDRSAFTDDISEQVGFEVVGTAELLREGLAGLLGEG